MKEKINLKKRNFLKKTGVAILGILSLGLLSNYFFNTNRLVTSISSREKSSVEFLYDKHGIINKIKKDNKIYNYKNGEWKK